VPFNRTRVSVVSKYHLGRENAVSAILNNLLRAIRPCGMVLPIQNTKKVRMASSRIHRGCLKGFIGLVVVSTAVIVAAVSAIMTCGQEQEHVYGENSVAETSLYYLEGLEEIKWVEVDGNAAYIGFDPLPTDWQMVIRGAAFKVSAETDFGFHAWAVRASEPGWRLGDGPYYGMVTVRKKRLIKIDTYDSRY
jgi:hypothetical protein